jgi:hypothetical protein
VIMALPPKVAGRPPILQRGETKLRDAQAAVLEIEVLAISMWRAASLQDIQSAGLLKPCDAGLVAAIRETGRLLYHSANRARPASGKEFFLASYQISGTVVFVCRRWMDGMTTPVDS